MKDAYYAEVAYNDKVLQLPGCDNDTKCSLETFRKILHNMTREDYEDICSYKPDKKIYTDNGLPNWAIILIAIVGFIVLSLVLKVTITCCCRYSTARKKSRRSTLSKRNEDNIDPPSSLTTAVTFAEHSSLSKNTPLLNPISLNQGNKYNPRNPLQKPLMNKRQASMQTLWKIQLALTED